MARNRRYAFAAADAPGPSSPWGRAYHERACDGETFANSTSPRSERDVMIEQTPI
jgi:hypothetical protein